MASEKKPPTFVSSEDMLAGDTGMPDTPDGGLFPTGTSDAPLDETTTTYSQTFPELIEKSLHTKKFFRPKFLLRSITLGWFGVVCWILISDQNNDRLTSIEDLKFSLIKIGIVTLISLIAMISSWLFADRTE